MRRRRAFLSLFDFFLTFDDEKEDEEGLNLLSFLSLSLSFFERNFMKSKTLNRWNVFRVSKFLSLFVLVFHCATIFVFFCAFFVKFFSHFFSSLTEKKGF